MGRKKHTAESTARLMKEMIDNYRNSQITQVQAIAKLCWLLHYRNNCIYSNIEEKLYKQTLIEKLEKKRLNILKELMEEVELCEKHR